jgi:hypothetical protein
VQLQRIDAVSAAHPKTSPTHVNPTHRFRELEINPNMYLLNWLMALYTKSLPLDLVRSLLLASLYLAPRDRSDPRACRSRSRALAMPFRRERVRDRLHGACLCTTGRWRNR